MSTMLIIMAVYIIIDRVLTVLAIGGRIEIDGAFVVVSLITGTFFVWVLLEAANGGVTP